MLDQVLGRGFRGMGQGLGAISAPLSTAARWLIIVGIAYTLAMTVLFFLSGSEPADAPVGERQQPNRSAQPAVNIDAIVSRHLFGVADAPAEEAPAQETAVVTRLPLELQAVFVAEENEHDESISSAIIAQKGKGGLLYRLGELVPGNAELVAVHADHVILSRAGSRERLNFPQLQSRFQTYADDDPNVYADDEPPMPDDSYQARQVEVDEPAQYADELVDMSAGEALDSIEQRLDTDPDALLNDLGVEQAEGGGYRIGTLAQSPQLSQSGLQPGDVILSLNGQPVGDVDADRAYLTQVLEQGSARIEIQRGTRRFFVTTSLK